MVTERNPKRRWRRYAGAAITAIVVGAGGLAYIGGDDAQNPIPTDVDGWSGTGITIDPDNHYPGLSPRGAAAGAWCGSVGTLGTPDSCWELGGATATDQGSQGWDLILSGTPATGVESGVPVLSGGSVSWTGEQAVVASAFYAGMKNNSVTFSQSVASMTVVAHVSLSANVGLIDLAKTSSTGFALLASGGKFGVVAEGGSGTLNVNTANSFPTGWYCVTAVANGHSTAFYVNGVGESLGGATTDHGTVAATAKAIYAPIANNATSVAMVTRARVDWVAATLADHQALCGSWGAPLDRSHTAFSDVSFARTGGAICLPTSATAAVCLPDSVLPYYWDGTDRRILAGIGGGLVNHFLYNNGTGFNCTNWTCRGSATMTAGKVAPDGSATASEIVIGAKSTYDIYRNSGNVYSAPGVTLYPSFWIKCAAGTFRLIGGSPNGDWSVDCSAVGGVWTHIHGGIAGGGILTEINPWTAIAGSPAYIFWQMYASSGAPLTADIWQPTMSEEPNPIGLTVPTGAAAVDTGASTYTVDNTSGAYWASGATVANDVTEHSGTCWVTGSTLRLSGEAGSPCLGGWNLLSVVP